MVHVELAIRGGGRAEQIAGTLDAARIAAREQHLAEVAPHMCGQMRRDFGTVLLARGDARSVERARDLLGAAAAAYRQLDMDHFAVQTAALLERARQTRRPGAQKAAGRIRLVR